MSVYQCTPNEQAERDLIALDLFVILSILFATYDPQPLKRMGNQFFGKNLYFKHIRNIKTGQNITKLALLDFRQ